MLQNTQTVTYSPVIQMNVCGIGQMCDTTAT